MTDLVSPAHAAATRQAATDLETAEPDRAAPRFQAMRPACAEVLAELGDRFEDLVVLAADGHALAMRFLRAHPERFVDVGIAEANLVGVAAGIARTGRRVVVGTMAPFLVRRAAEQIRLDVCQPGLDVTLVGIGGGLGYGTLGATHHVTEDLAALAAMPGTRVFCPVDVHDAAWALREAVAWPGPAYVRLGAREDEVVFTADQEFSVDRPRAFGEPGGALVVATGATVPQALRAAERVRATGLPVQVLALTCVAPFPSAAVAAAARTARVVVTVEEHLAAGGLASGTALALAGWWHGRFVPLAVDGRRAPVADRGELFRFYGIDSHAISCALLAPASEPGVTACASS
ncbi:transketolase [Kitasatospora sp. GAS204A]|uniref:transketolase family protein n=1 Tax=unclassified Kitasatospora TaxID=2633591 RepID=UPI002476A00F|nr:transketolase C-terminal domain-containing protein [Kitasatospora sp. GAS204B]MDH6118599.1 transketolase [Kitasatospora sp. GAS204B]